MDLGIGGKVAVVAASSRGLGFAVASSLVREGARVVISGRDPKSLAAAADTLRATGGSVHALCSDVVAPGSAADLIDTAHEVFGGLDIVVANAGGPPSGRAIDVSESALRDALEANFLASVRLAQRAIGTMVEQGWGRVVFLSSYSIVQAIPDLALSNTSRVALYAWAKTAASDLRGTGVTVNAVCPGPHGTERMAELARASGAVPGSELMGSPEDFGDVVAFVCSRQAGFVSGSAIVVDGGATLAL